MGTEWSGTAAPPAGRRGADLAKRLFDLVFALFGLVVLAPLLLLIAVLVRLDSPGPALFAQTRVGLGGKPFRILKFRTMRRDAERAGKKITVGGDARITRVGAFLRKWKLDELPQLINVLRGEMSLVGPRPEVPEYVAHYTPEQRRVLEVRPGITDLASVEFRDENELLLGHDDPEAYYLSDIMPRKLELNLRYLDRRSLGFELYVIFLTLARVLGARREVRRAASGKNS